jgi:hypothetical protein
VEQLSDKPAATATTKGLLRKHVFLKRIMEIPSKVRSRDRYCVMCGNDIQPSDNAPCFHALMPLRLPLMVQPAFPSGRAKQNVFRMSFVRTYAFMTSRHSWRDHFREH